MHLMERCKERDEIDGFNNYTFTGFALWEMMALHGSYEQIPPKNLIYGTLGALLNSW